MQEIHITAHAREQMAARQIPEAVVLDVACNPQQQIPQAEDTVIHQSILYFPEETKTYLVRVFLNVVKTPKHVITVYRTSKIQKYWHDEN